MILTKENIKVGLRVNFLQENSLGTIVRIDGQYFWIDFDDKGKYSGGRWWSHYKFEICSPDDCS
jgi:hypothetical protein